jgi:hypothetical protein
MMGGTRIVGDRLSGEKVLLQVEAGVVVVYVEPNNLVHGGLPLDIEVLGEVSTKFFQCSSGVANHQSVIRMHPNEDAGVVPFVDVKGRLDLGSGKIKF